MDFEITLYKAAHAPEILRLSMRAWEPVFEKLKPAVQDYVYEAFYPQGWRVRQTADITAYLETPGVDVWVAVESDATAETVLGWVGIRIHPEDHMGEIFILAVDPEHQRRGIGAALLAHSFEEMRRAGMGMVMVETGDDPGHAPSRATYEAAGFERWPVARYFRKL